MMMKCRIGDLVIMTETNEENRDIVGVIVEVGGERNGKWWDWVVWSKGRRFKDEEGKKSLYGLAMDWQLIPIRADGEDKGKNRGLKIS